jgi:hypothetical protein
MALPDRPISLYRFFGMVQVPSAGFIATFELDWIFHGEVSVLLSM